MRTPEDMVGELINRFQNLNAAAFLRTESYYGDLPPDQQSHIRVYEVSGDGVPTIIIPFFNDRTLCRRLVEKATRQ